MALNPLGPIAGEFCLDNSEVAVIMGPVGSAKTTAAALRVARHAMEQRPGPYGVARSRWAIVRNTGPQLNDTTLKSWLKLFPEKTYGKFETTKKTQRWRFVPKGMNKMIDAEFVFRALDDEDDVANLLSAEYTGAWFNEVCQIDSKILAHMGRRVGRYPGADLGGCTWRGWIGDTNPWAFTSDLHEMFVTAPREGYKFFKQPGGLDEGAENLENLEQTEETLKLPYSDPRRREQGKTYYTKALRDYTPDDANMFVHCKYGASRAGKPCYPSYNDNTHCKPVVLDPAALLLVGYDNTGRNPAAIVAQKSREGQWRIKFEYVEQNMGLKQHAQNLKRLLAERFPAMQIEKITCDPAGRAKDAHDQDSRRIIADVFVGTTVLNARTNDMATRLEAADGTFRRLVNGEPAIIIDPACKVLRAACISEYHFRKLKVAGAERYTDEPNKTHPHGDAAEGLQYLLLGGGEGSAATRGTDERPVKDWTPKGHFGREIKASVKDWNPYNDI